MSKKKNSKGSRSGDLTFLHKNKSQHFNGIESETHEESIVATSDGKIIIKFYVKNSKGVSKILIVGNGDSFKMKDENGERAITKAEMLNEVKNNKNLKFALDFIKTQKGGSYLKGGAKAKSKSKAKTQSKKTQSKPKVSSKKSKSKSKSKAKTHSKSKSKKIVLK